MTGLYGVRRNGTWPSWSRSLSDGPAEDAQGDGGGAELDDVVGADDGGVGDRGGR